MEESEKRKERLKAMRLEADQAIVSCNSGSSPGVSSGLTNPLNESSPSRSMQADSSPAPRFDYYTDPMAAFSANKRRSKVRHQVPQDFYTPPRPRSDMTPSPAYGTNSYSPDPRMFQAQGVYHSSPPGSPMHKAGPFGSPHVDSFGIFDGPNRYSPHQRMFQPQGVYQSSPQRSPMHSASPFGTPQASSPGVFRGSMGPPSSFPPNLSGGGSLPRPSFAQYEGSPRFGEARGQRFNSPGPFSGRGGSPYPNTGRGSPYPNTGRGSPYPNTGRGSPYPNTGRGRNQWLSNSNQRGKGRFGSHSHASAECRPDMFYNRSMVEDPWKHLEPVLWRRQSSDSWLPKSVQKKKAKVAEDSKKSTSEPSLAEYLAASFNQPVDSAATDS